LSIDLDVVWRPAWARKGTKKWRILHQISPRCGSLMRLDPANHFVEIALRRKQDSPMSQPSSPAPRHIVWQSVTTVLSAAVLISAEVFGAAFAGGWALASLFGFGDYALYAQAIFFLLGVAVMVAFVRNAMRVEPFTR
jgi:hypothetical protein